nr:hypothetical protein [uncultured Desulfobacter sp.]
MTQRLGYAWLLAALLIGALSSYCRADVLGNNVFVVAIPFEKSLYSKHQIAQ